MARFILLSFLLLSLTAHAQKVKYKDLFGLLSTKQFEPAEPFLKKYLLENDDNPNAFLYMGMIFQEKAAKMDVLKQTPLVIVTMDSAVLYYDKAFKTIDEREVRKNKEYYQAYNRRDLRTGEFGVKLSDIQFDIESRIKGLRERTDKVKMVKHFFDLSDSLYKKSVSLFKNLQDEFPSERQLYLRADEQTLKKLSSLSMRFDSCLKAFDSYKSSTTNLGRMGYNQTITLLPVNDFKNEGSSVADFYQDDLKLWDFKKFADKATLVIQKEIVPMRSHLVTYDIEINKLRERLNKDSASVRSDLTKLIDVLLYDQLKRYDPEPLPMEVFSMKTADLEYRSVLIEHKRLRDSSDLHLQLRLLETESKFLAKLDSIATKLAAEDIDQEAIDYGYFVTTAYSNTIVLHSYIRGLKEFAAREKRKKQEQLALYQEALKWIVDGPDSIPLQPNYSGVRFKPLFVADENYTVGLNFKDSLNAAGYLYSITPSRRPALKVLFPVDKAAFHHSAAPVTKALTYSDAAGQVFYVLVYREMPAKDKYPATIAKIYRSDGLAWSQNFSIGFIPNSISFRPETSELTVKDDSQAIVIDKNGKLLR
ncbi:MAG TPA: hypothetical protein VEB86_10730 [Chryseosolibacter sp.]|nr:hypothetical protein [Chryseosolibacter sp.]